MNAITSLEKQSVATAAARKQKSQGSRVGRRAMVRTTFVLWAAVMGLTAVSSAQTIQRISAPGKFYVDDKSSAGVVYNYAVYSVSNGTGFEIPSTYVTLTNIHPTNRIQLAPIDNGVRVLGAMAPGETKLAAFYLKGPSFTGNSDTLLNVTNETHEIRVLNGPPGVGSVLASANYSYTNIIFVIEAAANKITIITNLNPLAILGSDVTLVIAGETGTIGGNNSISFSPGVLGSWRPDAYQLMSSVVRFSKNPTYTNRLYFDPSIGGFTDYSGQIYTNTFHFRAVRVTGTNLPISPFAFVDSGSGTKHTVLDSLIAGGGSNIIYSASNVVSIVSHTVTPSSLLAPGGLVTYSVTFSNQFLVGLNLDEIVNTLPGFPGNVTYVPGSATYNSNALVDPNINGQTLRWAQPFALPAYGSGTLTFQAIAPLPAGQYTNRVVGIIGSEQIDRSLDTEDSSPAISVFTVIPVSDLSLAKTAPASTPAAGNFDYTLTVTNLGPSPASNLVVTDALPASVSFVSASDGGFLSGGLVIWTNLSITASNTKSLTLTVTAPSDAASLTNTASVSGPDLDPNSTNNVVPPVFTSVTPVADLELIKGAPPIVANSSNFNYLLVVTNYGPSAAADVAVTDMLPPGVAFVGASNGGFFNAGNVLWTNLGSIAANGSVALTLTVTAPSGGSVTNTASVSSPTADPNGGNNVTPPVVSLVGNVPPTTVDDFAATTRNGFVSVDVLANDSDANGDPIGLIAVTQTNGTATINGASVEFTPATNFLGVAVLTYTVTDFNGGTNTGLLTISVTNRPPVALNDAAVVTNGVAQALNPLANDSDPDGDALTITNAVASNGNVSINPGGTNLTFTATNSFNGTISYTVSDGFGGLASATIFLTGTNLAPAAINQNIDLPEDTSTNLVCTATDQETNLVYAILTNPTNGTLTAFDPDTGAVTYTPDTNYFGPDGFTFTAFDGDLYATGAVTIAVSAVNDAPVATNETVITLEDTATNLVLTASDVDNTNLVFAILANPTNGVLGVLNTNSGAVTYMPALDYSGPDGFTFTVFDGSLYATGAVSISVLPVNDAPILANDSVVVSEDSTNSIPVLANDSDTDGDPLTLISVTTPANGSASIVGTNVVYIPAPDFNGTNTFTYFATDGTVTNSALIVVVVTPVNDAPVLANDSVTMSEDGTNSIPVLANDSDVDGDPLTLVSVTTPANGTATIVGTNVVYIPAPDFNGTNTFTYFATDGTVTNSATVTVIVTPVEDAPLLVDDTVVVSEDSTNSIPVLANDSDADGDTLTLVSVTTPANGSASIVSTNVVYIPAPDFHGTNTFTYFATDGTVTNSATITVIVTPVNDPPVLVDDSITVFELSTNNIPVLANDSDVDGDPLTLVNVMTTNGTAAIQGNEVVYTPAPGVIGTNVLTYFATDGTVTNSALITVIVVDMPISFSLQSGAKVFNPQTGLYEQTVVVTNVSSSTVAALRLLAGDFASTNGTPRTNVWLWNAHGTNFDGRRYVQHNSPLDPGQFVSMRLEFYNPTRLPFTNSLEAVAVLPVPAATNLTGGVDIDAAFVDGRESGNPRFVIEWTSIPGRSYTVIYGPSANGPWTAATPSVTATATRTQWYDDGPPKTASKPLSSGTRFYRVILNP